MAGLDPAITIYVGLCVSLFQSVGTTASIPLANHLHAARSLSADPRTCIVVEDGTHGITAALAAGMTPLGLTAGSHCNPDHAKRLRTAGAAAFAATYDDLEEIIAIRDNA